MGNVNAILTNWYVGEVGGRALFTTLAEAAESDEGRKWRALAAVESRVASRLAIALSIRGCPVPVVADAAGRARRRFSEISDASWLDKMQWLSDIVERALRKMRADAAALPTELHPIGAWVVDHELALAAFAESELSGCGSDSLRPIDVFLGCQA